MNDIAPLLEGPLGLLVGFFILVWSVLIFFSPFFWYGTNRTTKEISQKMDKIIEATRSASAEQRFFALSLELPAQAILVT